MSLPNGLSRGMLVLFLFGSAFLVLNNEVLAQTRQHALKAITALERISTTDKRLKLTIEKAAKDIGRSLSHFLDQSQVSSRKVFEHDRQAVERLLKALKHKHTPEEIKVVFREVIDALVEADRRITERSIATAQRFVQIGEGSPRKVARAQREFETAKRQTNPLRAIRQFKKAWETSQEVVEGRELVIKRFSDTPDPLFPGESANTLSVTFQIHKKRSPHWEEDRGKKYDRGDKGAKRGKRYGRRNSGWRRGHGRRDIRDVRDEGVHRADKGEKEKDEDQFILECVEIIQNSSGRVVRTLTTENVISPPFQTRSDRFLELTVTSAWDGRDETGKVVPGGTYHYIAFGRIVRGKSVWNKRRRGHRSDRRGHKFKHSRYGKGANKRETEAVSFPVVGTISVVQLGVTITSPPPNSVIDTSTVLVEGVIDALPGTEVGVTVNGVVGLVNDLEFAALVPVDVNVSSITVTASDGTGTTATDLIPITVQPVNFEPNLFFRPSPAIGTAPLSVEFTLTSRKPITQIDLDFDGDGTVDFQGTTLEGQTFSYESPGLFFPKVTVTDNVGDAQTDTALVQVWDLNELDILLQAKWRGMRDALHQGEFDHALNFITFGKRESYRRMFMALGSDLADIEQILTEVSFVDQFGARAVYQMIRVDEGIRISHFVLFVMDEDGIWRLKFF